jgi:hypothetical protein
MLEEQWAKKQVKMDWLGLEDFIRLVYGRRQQGKITDQQALAFIAEAMSAFTRRGDCAGYEGAVDNSHTGVERP